MLFGAPPSRALVTDFGEWLGAREGCRKKREDPPDQIGNRLRQKVLGREMMMITAGISFYKTDTKNRNSFQNVAKNV